MPYDYPYRVESELSRAEHNGYYTRSYGVYSTNDGLFCTADQFWKARMICEALNQMARRNVTPTDETKPMKRQRHR